MSTIIPDLSTQKVWFLVGSQGLYGEETLRQVAQQSQQVVRTLNESGDIPVSIEWRPVLTDSDTIHSAIMQANAAADVIGVITWMHTFSPSKM